MIVQYTEPNTGNRCTKQLNSDVWFPELSKQRTSKAVIPQLRCVDFRRRRNVKAIEKGNNAFGRKGCPRCVQCRKWKRKVSKLQAFRLLCIDFEKCVFSDISLPCESCVGRNFPCNIEDKVFSKDFHVVESTPTCSVRPGSSGPPTVWLALERPLPSPDDQAFDTVEGMYIQKFHHDMILMDTLAWKRVNPSHPLAEYLVRRFGVSLTSKSVRYAALLSVTFRNELSYTQRSFHYLNQVYISLQEAISFNNYAELAYACYAVVFHSFLARPFSEMIFHGKGFLKSTQHLIKSPALNAEERIVLKAMAFQIYCLVIYDLERQRSTEGCSERLRLAFEFAESASFLLHTQGVELEPDWISREDLRCRSRLMVLSLQVYLSYYAALQADEDGQVTESHEVEAIVRSLVNDIYFTFLILSQGRSRISHRPQAEIPRVGMSISGTDSMKTIYIDPAHLTAKFWYYSAIILQLLFSHSPSSVDDKVMEPAIHICSLAAQSVDDMRAGVLTNPGLALFSLMLAEFVVSSPTCETLVIDALTL